MASTTVMAAYAFPGSTLHSDQGLPKHKRHKQNKSPFVAEGADYLVQVLTYKSPNAIPKPIKDVLIEKQTSHPASRRIDFDALLRIFNAKMLNRNQSHFEERFFNESSHNFKFMLKFLLEIYYFKLITKAFLKMCSQGLRPRGFDPLNNLNTAHQSPLFLLKDCIFEFNSERFNSEPNVLVDCFEEPRQTKKNSWDDFFLSLAYCILAIGDCSVRNKWLYLMVFQLSTETESNPFACTNEDNQEHGALCNLFLLSQHQEVEAALKERINVAALSMKQKFFSSSRAQTKTVSPENQGRPTPEGVIETLNEAINDAWHDALLMLIQVRAGESDYVAKKWLEERRNTFQSPENFVPGDVPESAISTATQMCPINFVENSKDPCFKKIIPSLNKLLLEACDSRAV